ncbi:unnamed protein product [Ixodes hexagonus]
MTISSQLVVPMTLWGKVAPTHCMCSVFITKDQKMIVTGCNDGQICVWDIVDGTKVVPRSMLFGHTGPVLCLASASPTGDGSLLVSSSEAGEMSLWDLTDGRCLESTKLPYVHTYMQSHMLCGGDVSHLFCNGYYADVVVLDTMTLTVAFSLVSRATSDWISAMHVIRTPKRCEDIIVALSSSGLTKVWMLSPDDLKSGEALYECESKPIRCLNALRLTCCAYNQRTILVVTAKYWHIYDANDFVLLCTMDNRPGERWMGGDFISADRVCVWSDHGRGYLYQLPAHKLKGKAISAIAESKEYRSGSGAETKDNPFLFCVLAAKDTGASLFSFGLLALTQRLLCPPAMGYFVGTRGGFPRVLLRGDSSGRVTLWNILDVAASDVCRMRQESGTVASEGTGSSLGDRDNQCSLGSRGTPDGTPGGAGQELKLTASVYLPLQGRLVVGREDGSIVVVSATQAVMLQLLYGKHHHDERPQHQLLHGHVGRVTCLLYPHHVHSRYEIAHLVSGGVDFSVCLWDLYAGTLLHRFCVHAGEVSQLLVPPNNCSNRVLQSVCSVASDHSVALVGLKERKCVVLASRHLFPVAVVKWRPFDDFMVVGCSDGSVYVWQMETGHLDRVLQGLQAEEVLSACDEHTGHPGERMTNPAVHLFRGLRHRNMAAIRHAAQRGLHHLQHHPHHHQSSQHGMGHDVGDSAHARARTHPLMIQGLRTNPVDQDSHVLFFDIEALIGEQRALLPALSLSLSSMQGIGKGSAALTDFWASMNVSHRGLHHKTFNGHMEKMLQAAEAAAAASENESAASGERSAAGDLLASSVVSCVADTRGTTVCRAGSKLKHLSLAETNLTMEIAQLLLSLLHAWGLDHDLDKVCEGKLGLLCPMRPICFGLLSRGGHMSLLLPTHTYRIMPSKEAQAAVPSKPEARKVTIPVPREQIEEEERARRFSSRGHWELSTAVTTNHLLSVIALANTLMSMNSATFVPEQEKRRKLHRWAHDSLNQWLTSSPQVPCFPAYKSHFFFPKFPSARLIERCDSYTNFSVKTPQNGGVRLKQWCDVWSVKHGTWNRLFLQVREAAQALLLAELRRIGPKGRKAVVDEWGVYLPNYGETFPAPQSHHGAPQAGQAPQHAGAAAQGAPPSGSSTPLGAAKTDTGRTTEAQNSSEEEEDEDRESGEPTSKHAWSAAEGRRKQSTAIVLLGVIGAEYGHEIEQSKRKNADDQKKKSLMDGFGPVNYSLARHTSQALAYLLLTPPTAALPAHTSLRRAAIDLIGRGFTVWEPCLDVSRVLLGLLELCCDSDKLVPSMSYGLPLTPAADSCRTARHALSLIATARPPAFITTLAREVHRYNTLAQNAQSLNISLHQTVLSRARPEILRIVELLIDKMQTEVADLLVEVMEIVLHCLDPTQLKTRGLENLFPAICRFNNVSYCGATRRIAVGAKTGQLALYELRASKSQLIAAHSATVVACTFSPDGKYLATYSSGENKLCFWQTAAGLFGLGNAQTRCVRTYSTPPLPKSVCANPLKMARLVWVTSRIVILLLADGSEHRFNLS